MTTREQNGLGMQWRYLCSGFSAIIMVMPAVLENTISFSFVAFTFLQGWGLQRLLFGFRTLGYTCSR
jgi:hypothetical protein